ncbi:MBL fold metallo-hydrolase [Aureibacter tunicatorum]|uniref:Phosphoribosyl 1,2-cyclic phosphate phosphodiesterase n=1 Tax=Aureibacter tunicatorum TaxID=866807 RepID=A0AAE4BT22_9BACT|nr:MBL fold metallo-hydrolase [Aureibacter tunicatorum]MDR6239037.1 phosphoribosyl 1,2-cyclic phosphate phosphodiesterase [Aureibacter tunicatorum]BDD05037.1 MBL fold metallo-hydrolase [Aureibacter tunicatorum]
MKITFLGTGTSQGVPVINCNCPVCSSLDFRDNRLRTSVHIEIEDKSIIIDTGPDFRQQVLRENIHNLDAILFTHQHKDHVAGLDDVRGFNFSLKKSIPIFARKQVLDQLEKEFPYIFNPGSYKGAPRIIVNEIKNELFSFSDINIIPIEVMHATLPTFGFRINDFVYITDAKTISDEELEKTKNAEILVVNGLQYEEHISHFTIDEALEFIEKANPKKAYITHISHRLGMHNIIDNKMPENVSLAYDGLTLSI